MKKMKKFFAVILSLAMILGMSVTAMATTVNIREEANITVENAENATLTYAQVIKADRTTRTGWNFVNDDVAQAYMDAFEQTDAQAVLEILTGADVDAAKLGAAQAAAAGHVTFATMANPQTVTEAGIYLVRATETGYTYNIMAAYVGFGTVKIDDVSYAYPSLLDATLTAKKTPTTVTKTVDNTDKVTHTGDTLTYTVTAYVPYIAPTDTNKTFWVYDALTGAEYNKDATITLDGNNVTNDYTINWTAGSFSVDLSAMINDANSNAGKPVVITYSVTVTSENDTITNNASAGHEGGSDFGSTTTNVYEGNITLTKTNENGRVFLAGAGFEVRKDNGTDALTFTKLADGVYKYDPNGNVTEVVTKEDGTVKIQGLDVGTYTFKEITAPEGYSVNTEDVSATLALGEDETTASAVLTASTSMKDTKLSALPSTGGIGTTIFTIAGCAIMVAAAFFFFASRKKANK